MFKGTVSRDFLLLVFFSSISFPQAPDYAISTDSNFFRKFANKKSQINDTVVVDTGGKWKKSSIKKFL